jgi:hypothetical protein
VQVDEYNNELVEDCSIEMGRLQMVAFEDPYSDCADAAQLGIRESSHASDQCTECNFRSN